MIRSQAGAAFAVLGLVALVACARFQPLAKSTAPAQADSDAAARLVLTRLLDGQPSGRAETASYVETTFAAYVAGLAPESRNPNSVAAMTDKVIILKVFGEFPSAHRGPSNTNTDATMIVVVYDEKLSSNVEVTYLRAPLTPDLSASASPSESIFADLRQLGTPRPILP
jgi:hypothetical protein